MSYNADTVPHLLSPEGPLASLMDPYEDRPYQREMTLEVARMLEEGGKLAVEAPTGIGKSLAYALPAALWARHTGAPVVVSTYTKALQEQLLRTETPRLLRLAAEDLRVAVLKGRANYLCRRRFELECRQATGEKTLALLARLRDWVDTTTTGDLAECGERDSRDLRYLHLKISSDAQFCAHRDCTPAGGCFFKTARQAAAEADLLIVNHALLAIELFEDGRLLPEFDVLIVDEAHAFVSASLDHLTRSIGPGRVTALLERAPGGFLPAELRSGEGETRAQALVRSLEHLEKASQVVFGKRNGVRPSGEQRERYRDGAELSRLCPEGFDPMEDALGTLDADVAALESFVLQSAAPEESDLAPFVSLLARFRGDVSAARRDLEDLLNPDPNDAGRVQWKEWGGADAFSLSGSPLEIGPRLASSLKDGPSRVLFTSATLAAGEDFGFFAREVGLEGDVHTFALPSPFDYERQVLAVALNGGPDPRGVTHPRASAAILDGLMRSLKRRAMALFTSYRDLRAVAAALSERSTDEAYSVLAQGVGESPAELLDMFRSRERGLLLGTASFWQGIDLPGDLLEVLVVARLPFGVPTDPRFEARSEFLEQRGGRPFVDLYLPEAVLRFKQGFGRLIRRRSDRGIVAILDPRVLTKSYGKRFLDALPVPVERMATGEDLVQRCAAWWDEATRETVESKGERR